MEYILEEQALLEVEKLTMHEIIIQIDEWNKISQFYFIVYVFIDCYILTFGWFFETYSYNKIIHSDKMLL